MEEKDKIIELRCNVDDMTGEDLAYAIEKIMEAGARDAFITPVIMKKGRPGYLITVLTDEDKREEMGRAIFTYTSTIGIREFAASRMVLERSTEVRKTEYGDVRVKVSEGYGVRKEKPEFEDIRKIADATGMSPAQIRQLLK